MMNVHKPDDSVPAGFLLIFQTGQRPTAKAVAGLLSAADSGISARMTRDHATPQGQAGILMSGLSFELRGLAPQAPACFGSPRIAYGFEGAVPEADVEAVLLVPGEHVRDGLAQQPVMQSTTLLASALALRLDAVAVRWLPADTIIEPRYLAAAVGDWLSGGAFPVRGLTALVPGDGGSFSTRGLGHFIGQELAFEGRADDEDAETTRLLAHVVEHLVRSGSPGERVRLPAGDAVLVIDPRPGGSRIRAWCEPALPAQGR